MSRHVVVVGGGIAGLAAAWEARERGCAVTVVEADETLGGKIQAASLAGATFDRGPDSFLARVPFGQQFVNDLGGSAELSGPLTAAASVYARGALRPLPAGHLLGVPGDIAALAKGGLFSARTIARLTAERLVLSKRPIDVAGTVREVLEPRLGREVLDTLVEPLIGGIYAGRVSEMELESVVPDVAQALAGHHSVVRAVAARLEVSRHMPAAADPVFLRPKGGLHRLIELAARRLGEHGVQIVLGATVDHVQKGAAGYELHLSCRGGSPQSLDADGIVICVPAWRAGPLLAELDPSLPGVLARVASAGVSMVTVALAPAALATLKGSGFLVPRSTAAMMTAATFISAKWGQRGAAGETLLRLSTGHAGDHRHEDLADPELTTALVEDFERISGVPITVLDSRVDRWPAGFPQYRVGHSHVVATVRAALRDTPVAVAGASYEGVGVAACIRQGREASAQVARVLRPTG